MKQILAVFFALSVGSLAAAAQSAGTANGTLTTAPPVSYGVAGMESLGSSGGLTTVVAPPANLCPVGVEAQHLSDGSMVQTRGAAHPKKLGQRLHLTLTTSDGRAIASATVNVHGWTAQGRLTQAASGDSSADAVRTVTAPFVAEGNSPLSQKSRLFAADLWVPGLTAVNTVEVVSVTYADRTTWRGRSCRVAADPLMLVAAH